MGEDGEKWLAFCPWYLTGPEELKTKYAGIQPTVNMTIILPKLYNGDSSIISCQMDSMAVLEGGTNTSSFSQFPVFLQNEQNPKFEYILINMSIFNLVII